MDLDSLYCHQNILSQNPEESCGASHHNSLLGWL